MKLKKLSVKNFRSFKELNLDFPDNGLLLLQGTGVQSGDSSGTGKSSIFLAIAYALDILPSGYSISEQTTWGEKEGFVELVLDCDGELVTIRKGSKPKLTYKGQEFVSPKTIQEELPKAIGISCDILRPLVYRAQGERSLFLGLSDRDKKEFLSSLFPELASIEKVADLALEKATSLKLNKEKLNSELLVVSQTLNNIKIDEVDTSELDKLVVAKDTLINARTSLVPPGKVQSQRARELQNQISVFKAEILSAVGSIKIIENAIIQLKQKISQIETNCKQIDRLKADRSTLEKSICSTCKQKWDNTEGAILDIDYQIEQLSASSSSEEKSKISSAILDLESKKPNVSEKTAKQLSLELELRQVEKEDNSVFEELQRAFLAKNDEFNSAIQSILQKIEHIKAAKSAYDRTIETHKVLQNRINCITTELNKVEENLLIETTIAEKLGNSGFLGKIFYDILKEVEYEANAFLLTLANASNISIQFSTEKTSKTGTTKTAIDMKVLVNGNEVKYNSGLSGGQKTSVEQAVDFGILQILQRRSGFYSGFLMLDEIFDGQGFKTKESTLEALKQSSTNKLIMVIDHDTMFRAMFDRVLDITNNNGYSSATFNKE